MFNGLEYSERDSFAQYEWFWLDACLVEFYFTCICSVELDVINSPSLFTACISFDKNVFAAFKLEGFLIPSFKIVVVGDFIVDEFNAIRGDGKDDRYIESVKNVVFNGDVFVVVFLLIIEIANFWVDRDDSICELEA